VYSSPAALAAKSRRMVVMHFNVAQIMFLLFPALLISIARHVSGSVRATIPIHATYNLTVNVSLIALMLDVFRNQG
jgi:hypothetical protein